MKKTIVTALVAIIAVFALFGCSAKVTDKSIKTGLEKEGYTVEIFKKETFEIIETAFALDTSVIEGLETIVYAHKTVDDREDGLLVLVFESAKKVKLSDANVGKLAKFAIDHAPVTDNEYVSSFKNTIWAGSEAAKNAAGLKK